MQRSVNDRHPRLASSLQGAFARFLGTGERSLVLDQTMQLTLRIQPLIDELDHDQRRTLFFRLLLRY
ncbi:hypothetical protein AK51_04465 [Serratia nematodiphila DZ0503SBS1]|nr:hypothetical protein AK51_04465 [Serratia nematodiphila DZ0503SBS1]